MKNLNINKINVTTKRFALSFLIRHDDGRVENRWNDLISRPEIKVARWNDNGSPEIMVANMKEKSAVIYRITDWNPENLGKLRIFFMRISRTAPKVDGSHVLIREIRQTMNIRGNVRIKPFTEDSPEVIEGRQMRSRAGSGKNRRHRTAKSAANRLARIMDLHDKPDIEIECSDGIVDVYTRREIHIDSDLGRCTLSGAPNMIPADAPDLLDDEYDVERRQIAKQKCDSILRMYHSYNKGEFTLPPGPYGDNLFNFFYRIDSLLQDRPNIMDVDVLNAFSDQMRSELDAIWGAIKFREAEMG